MNGGLNQTKHNQAGRKSLQLHPPKEKEEATLWKKVSTLPVRPAAFAPRKRGDSPPRRNIKSLFTLNLPLPLPPKTATTYGVINRLAG